MRQKRDKDENLLSLPKNQSNQENYRRGGIRFLYYKNKANLISIRYRKTLEWENAIITTPVICTLRPLVNHSQNERFVNPETWLFCGLNA